MTTIIGVVLILLSILSYSLCLFMIYQIFISKDDIPNSGMLYSNKTSSKNYGSNKRK